MRLFAWSDLHVDYPANFQLLEKLSRTEYRNDVLMVAGDVSSNLERLNRALAGLKERFAEVAFVPGNHDLWVSGKSGIDSLEKFHELRAMCRASEIRVEAFEHLVGAHITRVIPLVSWYLKPEEGAGSLFVPKPGEDSELVMWADNRRIRWPMLPDGQSPCAHLLSLNDRSSTDAAQMTVTFSHFLPRVELVFHDWESFRREGRAGGHDPHPAFNFTRVAGCRQLDERLRLLGSSVHVYGHQHRNRDRIIEGVRYVSHCLGYPPEWNGVEAFPIRHEPLEIKLNAEASPQSLSA